MIRALAVIFHALTLACPPEFRREYAGAMRRDFADGLHERSRGRGPLAALAFALTAYADLLLTGGREGAAGFARDLSFAVRSLRKTPWFAATVVLTLALAIGTNAAVFSIVRAAVLEPLPYPQASRLVAIVGLREALPFALSLPDFIDLYAQARGFTAMAAYTPGEATLTGRGAPRKLEGTDATSGFFQTLGVRPALGRFFDAADARTGAPKRAVISERLWRRYFADARALDATLTLDGDVYRIVGVAPATFRQPNFGGGYAQSDYWTVLPSAPSADGQYSRGAHYFEAVGRLRDGASVDGAAAELDAIFARLRLRHPADDARYSVATEPLMDRLVGNARPLLFALFAAVAGLLLVACANVANLLLSRAAARERELAVRVALGATRGRIIGQLLTETFALAAAGGVLGAALAMLAVRAVVSLNPPEIPRIENAAFDGVAAAFAFGVVLFATLAAGLAPALALSTRAPASALTNAGRAADAGVGKRLRGALAVAEIALTLALVVAAGLVARSFTALTSAPLGFDPGGLVAVGPLELPDRRYPTGASRARAYDRFVDLARAVPGVDGAALACCAPFSGEQFNRSFTIAGRASAPGTEPSALNDIVSPDFFRLLRVPIRSGRPFDGRDRAGAPAVAIVNEAFARRFMAGRPVLGARIAWGGASPGSPPPRTIVGVAGDARDSFARPQAPEIYLPVAQEPLESLTLYLRASTPAALAATRAVAAGDPAMPLPPVRRYDQFLAADAARARLVALTLSTLAALALALSVGGIFGVVSYGVAQRTHEFGIRMALGARGTTIARGVIADAMRTAGAGVTAGLLLAALTTHFLTGELYETPALDPLTFGAVAALIGAATFAAALLPARRATRVDPAVALRYD